MKLFWTITPLLLAGVLSLCVSAATPPDRPAEKIPRFHDPSTPIRQGDQWVVFSTGSGILTRYSQDLKTWVTGEPVFKDFPAWHRDVVPSQKGHLWAPDVVRRGDRYLLYYSVSGWGKNVSAIGLASSPTLDPKDPAYHWRDDGIVIRSGKEDAFNAIDPQIFADPDGSLWMVFGSFWTGIQLIELDPDSGLRHGSRTKIHQLAWHESIEAPALLKHGDYYYLFVNWGLCCRGLKSTYEIRVGRSRTISGPYLDAAGDNLATGGGTLFLGSEGDRIGPGHAAFLAEKGGTRMFYHYYDARRSGSPTLGDLPVRWTSDGWPLGSP
ncbi:arabinan endo-1,5-alpha-L-arabinosidase [bacterium]|nr:arabinan endo-1,5-alpha-L-arabinosidase [bacterium]